MKHLTAVKRQKKKTKREENERVSSDDISNISTHDSKCSRTNIYTEQVLH